MLAARLLTELAGPCLRRPDDAELAPAASKHADHSASSKR